MLIARLLPLFVLLASLSSGWAQTLKPLTEMSQTDRYKGFDGGLYGGGLNEPPKNCRAAIQTAALAITPRDKEGTPAADGKIVIVAMSMSNAEQEFGAFRQLAHADQQTSRHVVVVNTAQGGRAMSAWALPRYRCFEIAIERLEQQGVSAQQVQAAWVKIPIELIEGRPIGSKDVANLSENIKQARADTIVVLQAAKKRFPNLQIAYLSSRTYGGYAKTDLNPEPYAYESAFVARELILNQGQGEPSLNADPQQGEIKAPLLLWGPYLWADGPTPRTADKLTWERGDFGRDGVHPSKAGEQKAARLLLDFFQSDRSAKSWFMSAAE